ncbi:MAG: glycolate oxidase subunit GlcE [Halioglobus sp.]
MIESHDMADTLVEAVINAAAARQPLRIVGGNSKQLLMGRHCEATPLQVGGHRGIVDYTPEELVITARAGTPIAEIESTLAAEGQTLASEPPRYNGTGTLGGTLACNLSGPARPWCGALRDAVLGLRLIDGRGQHLRFGGRVMKNVAGYDVSRLQAGALGTLGVITEVSLKVMPRSEFTTTLAFATPAAQAIETMNRRAALPSPLNGALWHAGRLFLRLSGARSAVEQYAREWGGEQVSQEDAPWDSLREMQAPLFDQAQDMQPPLYRLSVGSATSLGTLDEQCVIDWCGALRWLTSEQELASVHNIAAAHGGHASLFRGGDRSGEVRAPLPSTQQALKHRLKQAFDPEAVFNPGRLYSWL